MAERRQLTRDRLAGIEMYIRRQDNPPQRDPAALQAWPVDSLAAHLSEALRREPDFEYLFSNEQDRRAMLPLYFRSATRAGHLYGEICATENLDGIAIWIRPENAAPFRRLMQLEPMLATLNQGREFAARYTNLYASVEEARRRLAHRPHWYLMMLVGDVSQRAIREALIEPVLARAESEMTSCYIETFSENNLPLYDASGFRIVGAGRISDGGPSFWAMAKGKL